MRDFLQRLTFWRVVAVIILATGLCASFIRFRYGLGASTNLTDDFPWGLWIGFDVLVGVGLAAGGFTIAATVYIFHLEKYEAISRPSLLTAYLGYALVGLALVFDVGRPLRLWHPLVMWNPNSVMFEVAWCVALYTTVLTLEFSPIVFEKFNLKLPIKFIHSIYMPLVLVGVLLSTLHQSSLGTVYVIVPDKLYGLWYSPLLPVFFFISAIAVGLAMTIVESFLSYRAFGKEIEHDVLAGLARVIAVVLAVYVTWKFIDLHHRGNISLAFQFTPESVLFWVELGLGAVLPAIIIFSTQAEISQQRLFLCALSVVMGFILNRLNVSITGMIHYESYIPKWSELAITLSMVVAGFVIFALAVRYLPVFPDQLPAKLEQPPPPAHFLSARMLVALWSVVILGAAGFMLAVHTKESRYLATPPKMTRKADPFQQQVSNMPAKMKIPRGEDSPGQVIFSHHRHISFQERLECASCHPRLFGLGFADEASHPTGLRWHSKRACGACHDGETASDVNEACTDCHEE